MKKLAIFLLLLSLVFVLFGCNFAQSQAETTAPMVTGPFQESEPVQTQPITRDPFELESEIDFSDFETAAPAPAEDEETQPSEMENPVQPKPTEPVPTEPAPTESEPTEPEETQTPTTATPSIGEDGYNNQIVRP